MHEIGMDMMKVMEAPMTTKKAVIYMGLPGGNVNFPEEKSELIASLGRIQKSILESEGVLLPFIIEEGVKSWVGKQGETVMAVHKPIVILTTFRSPEPHLSFNSWIKLVQRCVEELRIRFKQSWAYVNYFDVEEFYVVDRE